MIRMRAVDHDIVLTDTQVTKVKFWLLEFLPAQRCLVTSGPGVVIEVEERQPEDLTPTVRQRIEEIIGCTLIDE